MARSPIGGMIIVEVIFINLIVFVPLFAFVIWAAKKGRSRVRILLNHWIQDNGYTLVESKRVHFKTGFNTGPYRLVSKGQTVLRVTVLDENNITRTGWVRCGSLVKGSLSDAVEGVLDELPKAGN